MTNSFLNHFSPELREEDVSRLYQKFVSSNYNLNDSMIAPVVACEAKKSCMIDGAGIIGDGYYYAQNGKTFSLHFFFYSLINVPMYYVSDKLGGATTPLVIINVIIYLVAVLFILFFIKENTIYKLILLISLVSPTSWVYIKWTHPEVMTFSLIVISLVFLKRNMFLVSALIMAVASLQNPPLALAAC